LSYEQITKKGKYKILLTKAQKEKINESKKLKTGTILEFDHEQIKAGGFLPALIAAFPTILSILEGLAGGAAGIVNAVKNAKHQSAEEEEEEEEAEETKRHNLEMEKIAKTGSGLKKKKK
jgi:hypothetical protein